MPSKLDQLRAMTVVVADTGDLDAVRRLKPQDCTTNPTLLLKAVELPAYGHLLDEALAWGRKQGGSREAVVAAKAPAPPLPAGSYSTAEPRTPLPPGCSPPVISTRPAPGPDASAVAAWRCRAVVRVPVAVQVPVAGS